MEQAGMRETKTTRKPIPKNTGLNTVRLYELTSGSIYPPIPASIAERVTRLFSNFTMSGKKQQKSQY